MEPNEKSRINDEIKDPESGEGKKSQLQNGRTTLTLRLFDTRARVPRPTELERGRR